MVMKRFALVLPCVAVACAAPLATLPPSNTYTEIEETAPQLSRDEQKLVDAINQQFVQMGLPAATLGSHEQNAAAIMANAALAKVWNGSGRALAQRNPQEVGPAVSGQERVEAKHEVANGRYASLTDEQDDAEVKHLHIGQHLSANGIPLNVNVRVFVATYAQTTLEDDELKKFVESLRPDSIFGDLKIGVAIIPAGDADKRIFAIALRDRMFDIAKGPPRIASPGTAFDFAGTVFDRDLKIVKVGLMGPDGKVQLGQAAVGPQGDFSISMTIPNVPGLYVFTAGRAERTWDNINVPIFAGVSPTPWPVSADPNALPVDGTRAIVQRLAKAIAERRHGEGLPPVPIDSSLSALAKNEATLLAKAIDASGGPSSGLPVMGVNEARHQHLQTSGYDPRTVYQLARMLTPDYMNDFFARFPENAFLGAALGSPTIQSIGLGVVLVPNEITKDDDLVRYAVVGLIKDANSLEFDAPASAESTPSVESPQPLTVAIRADGTAAVDGAIVDDAQLKQRIDQIKAVNPNPEVILQVEEGSRSDVVQHVTDVIKAEGVTRLVMPPVAPSPTPSVPSNPPPPPPPAQ
jgi:biopolymer transport protein ExbD